MDSLLEIVWAVLGWFVALFIGLGLLALISLVVIEKLGRWQQFCRNLKYQIVKGKL